MILPLAMVASLAATCAPQIASPTLLAIAKTESALDPLAVHDNRTGQSYSPQDTAEAIAVARQLYDQGHSFDAGLMQINNRNFSFLGVTLESAFDPCKSLSAAASLLVSFSRYNTGGLGGFQNGYVARVVSASDSNSPQAQPAAIPRGGSLPPESGAKPQPPPHAWNAFPDPAELVQPGENNGLVER